MDIKKKSSLALRRLMSYLLSLIMMTTFIPTAFCARPEVSDCVYLRGRTYERTNTWNGCVRYLAHSDTLFHACKYSQRECVMAVNVSRHYVRYHLVNEHPISHVKTQIPEESEISTNDIKTIEVVQRDFGQFECPVQGDFGREGRDVYQMEARILPFVVKSPHSKTDLHCILVTFFEHGDFVMATYFNLNTGKVVLDFHDISDSGWMLLAEESRYPYLLPAECVKQDEILVRYGNVKPQHCENPKGIPVQPLPEVQVIVPDL